MRLHVGNLAPEVTDADLRKAFERFGKVEDAAIETEGWSGESKGFGWVAMPIEVEATRAMREMDGADLKGRTLAVNPTHPAEDVHEGEEGGIGGGHPGKTAAEESGGDERRNPTR